MGTAPEQPLAGAQGRSSHQLSPHVYRAQPLLETGERCSSLGTKPGHALCRSSWPSVTAKGDSPKGSKCNLEMQDDGSSCSTACCAFCSNNNVAWAIFAPTPSGLRAQTPLPIPSTFLDQELPTANLLQCTEPCSTLQYVALLSPSTESNIQWTCSNFAM